MSPSEVEEYILQDPMPTLRLTLASGDQLIIRDEDRAFVSGLALVIRGSNTGNRLVAQSRLVSIRNIVLVEPATLPPRTGRRRRN